MLLLKIMTVILSIFICIGIVKYREQVVRTFGTMDWAERYLGPTGTYTVWIVIAIFIVFLAASWLVGAFWM